MSRDEPSGLAELSSGCLHPEKESVIEKVHGLLADPGVAPKSFLLNQDPDRLLHLLSQRES